MASGVKAPNYNEKRVMCRPGLELQRCKLVEAKEAAVYKASGI